MIKNDLNNREEEILIEAETYFNDINYKETLLKEIEDLLGQKLSLEKPKKQKLMIIIIKYPCL